jgi:glutaredoxin 3
MMKSITIFTTNTCAYCHMVKKYLTSKGYAYEEVNLDIHPERQAEALALSGAMTVPVTVIRSGESSQEIVVGWNPSRLIPALA